MKINGKEHYVIVYVTLVRGVDYTETQLIEDALNYNGPKMLESTTLNEIAKKNGYDCCNWSSHESDGEIKVTFKKRKECKCNDAIGQSCNRGSKKQRVYAADS